MEGPIYNFNVTPEINGWIFFTAAAILIVVIFLFAALLYFYKKKVSIVRQEIGYNAACDRLWVVLEERYQGEHGIWAALKKDQELELDFPIETLRRAMRKDTDRPNRSVVQKALDKLEPDIHKALTRKQA